MITPQSLTQIDKPPTIEEQERVAKYIIKKIKIKLQFSSGSCGDGSFDFKQREQEEQDLKTCIDVLTKIFYLE